MKKTLGGLLLLLLLLLAGSALGEISTNLRKETTYNPDNKKVATETYLDDNGNPGQGLLHRPLHLRREKPGDEN